ncbi:hypothetical protein [Komagataeibacter sp. FNDCR2]|uniref:hypothetical protein n=1 Tax=Komagataeibacter sp. FNDCR2 TaxID=2878682 RepID=UPI001E35C878|nr:hypothetical protein [Komagataeibacter sp. FNDCR2]MCE2574299.1 hypothetical protein [Komagataeibacter sp. FNDCR2]
MLVSTTSTQTGTYPSATDNVANDGTVSSPVGQAQQANTSSVVITISQAGLDFLAGSSSSDDSTALASAQDALSRVGQLPRSNQQDARAEAEQRIDNIKAQMRQLMDMKALLSPKALALELSQLARQLAAAVEQYAQSGGTSSATTTTAAVGSVAVAAPQVTSLNMSGANQSATDDGREQGAQQGETDSAGDGSSSASRQTPVKAESSGATTDDSQDFQQTVRGLASQIKALLHESMEHLIKQGATSDSNIQTTQNAVDTVNQAPST